jgi:hypothetical protein
MHGLPSQEIQDLVLQTVKNAGKDGILLTQIRNVPGLESADLKEGIVATLKNASIDNILIRRGEKKAMRYIAVENL